MREKQVSTVVKVKGKGWGESVSMKRRGMKFALALVTTQTAAR